MVRIRSERIKLEEKQKWEKYSSARKEVKVVRTAWHVTRRDEVMRMDVEGRREGRPKRRWMDSVNVTLTEKGLSGEEMHNKAKWRQLVRYIKTTASSLASFKIELKTYYSKQRFYRRIMVVNILLLFISRYIILILSYILSINILSYILSIKINILEFFYY